MTRRRAGLDQLGEIMSPSEGFQNIGFFNKKLRGRKNSLSARVDKSLARRKQKPTITLPKVNLND